MGEVEKMARVAKMAKTAKIVKMAKVVKIVEVVEVAKMAKMWREPSLSPIFTTATPVCLNMWIWEYVNIGINRQ